MRSGLATRVDRIAKHVRRGSTIFPTFICKVYDRDDNDIIGLRVGATSVPRQPDETIAQMLERARAETGNSMWAADYRVIDRWQGWSERETAENRSAAGPV